MAGLKGEERQNIVVSLQAVWCILLSDKTQDVSFLFFSLYKSCPALHLLFLWLSSDIIFKKERKKNGIISADSADVSYLWTFWSSTCSRQLCASSGVWCGWESLSQWLNAPAHWSLSHSGSSSLSDCSASQPWIRPQEPRTNVADAPQPTSRWVHTFLSSIFTRIQLQFSCLAFVVQVKDS